MATLAKRLDIKVDSGLINVSHPKWVSYKNLFFYLIDIHWCELTLKIVKLEIIEIKIINRNRNNTIVN